MRAWCSPDVQNASAVLTFPFSVVRRTPIEDSSRRTSRMRAWCSSAGQHASAVLAVKYVYARFVSAKRLFQTKTRLPLEPCALGRLNLSWLLCVARVSNITARPARLPFPPIPSPLGQFGSSQIHTIKHSINEQMCLFHARGKEGCPKTWARHFARKNTSDRAKSDEIIRGNSFRCVFYS